MPANVTRHDELPLLIATLTGYVSIDDMMHVFERSAELITPEDEIIYRITRVVDADSTFSDMLQLIQTATQNAPASSSDKRIRVVFVGTSSWITFARNAFQKRGLNVPAFDSMKTAMEYVRMQLDQHQMEALTEETVKVDPTALDEASQSAPSKLQ